MTTLGAAFVAVANFFTWLAQKSGQKNTAAMVAAKKSQDAVDRQNRLIHLEWQLSALGRGVVGEHEIGHFLPPVRTTDSRANPEELTGSECRPHRTQ